MDVAVYSYPPGDPVLIDKIVNEFLSQGKFDKLRKECMADADTKPAYQNLQQRVETTVSQFLKKQVWKPDLNKNQLRDSLRKHILESGFLDAGINRIVDQIVNPNILATVFMPEVEEVVYSYLSIPRPADKSQKQNNGTLSVNSETNHKVKDEVSDDATVLSTDMDKEQGKKCEDYEESPSPEKVKGEDASEKNLEKIGERTTYDSALDLETEEISRDTEDDMKMDAESQEATELDASDSTKTEEAKSETKEAVPVMQEEGSDSTNKLFAERMEVPSDESQESVSRMGVERLRISESDGVNAPDSDASIPLEINEKSMSDSRFSEDSILNKMSPISQGRLTPEDEFNTEDKEDGEEGEEEEEEEKKPPLTFIGRIPKLKREDSESSRKEETPKRMDMKSIYSSDESDSSKQSFGRSDSDDKRSREKKRESRMDDSSRSGDRSERKYGDERERKGEHRKSSSSDRKSRSKDGRGRDEKSRSRRDEREKNHSSSRDGKRGRSRERSSGDKVKGSSSSHSRSKSSSHHRTAHKSSSHDREHHRDESRSREKERSRHEKKDRDKRDFDRRKKEEEKRKKSKSVDDHGRERNKREDRRSTDRDSYERERDRAKESSSGNFQSEGRRREREQRGDESKRDKTQREESDETEVTAIECGDGGMVEDGFIVNDSDNELVVVEFEENVYDDEDDDDATPNEAEPEEEVDEEDGDDEEEEEEEEEEDDEDEDDDDDDDDEEEEEPAEPDAKEETERTPPDGEPDTLDFADLYRQGALVKAEFPKVVDDFYVKFNSTGFRYFEDWETTKFDCEEEFKEYIDEAEKDLSLLSDDGSDYEDSEEHAASELRNREIVRNSLKGFANFDGSLMFDPATYEFYKWSSKQLQDELHESSSRTEESSPGVAGGHVEEEKMSDEEEIHAEKNKENRERDGKVRKNLKLLNHYRRKIGLTFKRGKEQHRFARRQKKCFAAKVEERLEWSDAGESGVDGRGAQYLTKNDKFVLKECRGATENVLRELGRFPGKETCVVDCGEIVLVDPDMCDGDSMGDDAATNKFRKSSAAGENRKDGVLQRMKDDYAGVSPGEEEEPRRKMNGERDRMAEAEEAEAEGAAVATGTGNRFTHPCFLGQRRKRGIRIGLSKTKTYLEQKKIEVPGSDLKKIFNLPLSPESDDSAAAGNIGVAPQKKDGMKGGQRKRTADGYEEIPPKRLKDCRRMLNQKYESQDLYKPRPLSIGSKTRGRAAGRADDEPADKGTMHK